MKCSFCEQPLICKSCQRPFHARDSAGHTAVYQPDRTVHCPECQKVLACKACGFVYSAGDEEDKEEETS